MATRVSYPMVVKLKAIEMRVACLSVKDVMKKLNIKNVTQLNVWMKWYREGELHRLQQPVGKQYSYGKGPEYTSELEIQHREKIRTQAVRVREKFQRLKVTKKLRL